MSFKAVAIVLFLLPGLCGAQRLNLKGRDLAIPYVFGQIKSQLGFEVIYSPSILSDAPRVDLDLRNADLGETMQSCFAGLQLGWTVSNRNVIVFRKVSLNASLYIPLHGRLLGANGEPLEGASISIDSQPM
ncbi:MAG: STN domain-containing protein, partial [Bacteroidetes bacterium]|nr:STN domain-containing protein [Bacteroidota bacterium]